MPTFRRRLWQALYITCPKFNLLSFDSNSSLADLKLPTSSDFAPANRFTSFLASLSSRDEVSSCRWQESNRPALVLYAAFHLSRSAVISPHWTCQLLRSALMSSFWPLVASSSNRSSLGFVSGFSEYLLYPVIEPSSTSWLYAAFSFDGGAVVC